MDRAEHIMLGECDGMRVLELLEVPGQADSGSLGSASPGRRT